MVKSNKNNTENAVPTTDNKVTVVQPPVEPIIEDEVKDVTIENSKVMVTLVVTMKGGFSDRYTGANYAEGQEIEVSEDRAKELLSDDRKLVVKK